MTKKSHAERMLDNFQVHTLRHSTTGHVVKLYEMAHVAPEGFFLERQRQFAEDHGKGFVVHHEGVQGAPSNFKLMESYKGFAELLGWTLQSKPEIPFEVYDAHWLDLSSASRFVMSKLPKLFTFTINQLKKADAETKKKSIYEFQEAIISGLKGKNMLDYVPFMENNLIAKRNALAVSAARASQKNVIMVWGKAHMPDLINRFTSLNYEIVKY